MTKANFDQYVNSISGKISEVKRKILWELWSSGVGFPREWVASSHLLVVTEQKYFDRRTRELRDQNGCDIETKHINGEHHYRLVSDQLAKANPRHYLTETQKRKLFEAAGNACQICGTVADAGVRGLQADHKIPLARNGTNDIHNWQAVCNECNVAKRRVCQGCEEQCDTCQWAFPELTGFPVTVRLPRDVFDQVQALQISDPTWLPKLISEAIVDEKK